MDTIAFTDTGISEIGVQIFVNGRQLIELAREVGLPFATAEGHPDIAGRYLYFGAFATFTPARHFLGEPMQGWTDGPGRIYVLACTCGIPECWALSARLEVRDKEIVWSDFRQIHRGPRSPSGEWCYDGLGPFVFDRQSYEAQLNQTPAPVKVVPPKRTRKTRLAEVFNLGFRHGANDRAAAGIDLGAQQNGPEVKPPDEPAECRDQQEIQAWRDGYLSGYRCGASDAELASVDVPGAHGMVSGFTETFMNHFGWLDDAAEEGERRDPSPPSFT